MGDEAKCGLEAVQSDVIFSNEGSAAQRKY